MSNPEHEPDCIICDRPTYLLLLELRHPELRRIGNYIKAPGYKWRRWPQFSTGNMSLKFKPGRIPE